METEAFDATTLGWPKTKYAMVERERRWLCDRIPMDLVSRSISISDIYFSGTGLRLREIRDLASGKTELKLTKNPIYPRRKTSNHDPFVEKRFFAALQSSR